MRQVKAIRSFSSLLWCVLSSVHFSYILAVQKRADSLHEPAGFGDLPPASVARFVPETSNSWLGNDALRFASTYAQGTTVKGFLCSDFVQVERSLEF